MLYLLVLEGPDGPEDAIAILPDIALALILQCTKLFGNGYFVRRTIKFASLTVIPYTLMKIERPA
jgi:hypothetical protein